MNSEVGLTIALLMVLLVHKDGGQVAAMGQKCQQRNAIPATMEMLTGSPWYLAAFVNSVPEERHERCAKTVYAPSEQNDEFVNIRFKTAEGVNDTMSRAISDVHNLTPGVFKMIPRNADGVSNKEGHIVVNVTFMEFTPGESFVTAHCEIRDGQIYTDRLTVAFKNRNVDPEKIRQKLKSVGVTDFTSEWILPQTDCED